METLRARADLTVEEEKDAWVILVSKRSGDLCRVTVPREQFEWFADVQRGGKEVWRDWMEHYDSPAADLDAEMAACVAAFIERVTTREIELPLKMYEE